MSGQERANRDKLFRLMQEFPELPVVPMVDGEIVADDTYTYWLGSWGPAEIRDYVVGNERLYFYQGTSDDKEEVLNDTLGGQDWYDATDEEVQEAYEKIPWIKAIVVYIDLPE